MRYYSLQHIDPDNNDVVICRAEDDYERKWGVISSEIFVGKHINPQTKPTFFTLNRMGE